MTVHGIRYTVNSLGAVIGFRAFDLGLNAQRLSFNNGPKQARSGIFVEATLRTAKNVPQQETVDLLNKCWMTHDGMWFFYCLQEFGIEATNRINKSAIKSLSSIEIARVRKALDCVRPIENFDDFKALFSEAARLMIPEFMNVKFDYPEKDKMTWAFNQDKCFAYAGIKRLGVIEQYECGVLYRIKCWLDELGITHRFVPEIGKCHMHFNGSCSGKIQFSFPVQNT